MTPAEPRPLQPSGIRARRQTILLEDFSFVHVVVHNCTWPVCLRHVDLSRSGTDSGPACAAQVGSAELNAELLPDTVCTSSTSWWTERALW